MTKPIILSSYFVQAVLNGQKVQLRRVVKSLCGSSRYDYYAFQDGHTHPYYFRRKDAVWDSFKTLEELAAKYCPFGAPGDRLWVRETFAVNTDDYGYIYKVDNLDWESFTNIKWKSPATMPRHASRIMVENTMLKVERLQDSKQWEWVVELKRVDF